MTTFFRQTVVLVAMLLLVSCEKVRVVRERPPQNALVGKWGVHHVEPSVAHKLGDDFKKSRSVVTLNLLQNGDAEVAAFPAFENKDGGMFVVLNEVGKWRLAPLGQKREDMIWNVIVLLKGQGISFVVKKEHDTYVLECGVDPELSTGIQFVRQANGVSP
jgi:hypothetical protein